MFVPFLMCALLLKYIASQNPCDTDKILDDSTRTAAYTLGDEEKEKCDHDLYPSWYKIENGGNILTSCPPVMRCGSTFPIWINGTLPNVKDTEVTLEACQRGFLDTACCQSQFSVMVRNCGTFNVYKLTPIDSCPGRYCIVGPPTPCADGYSSETGFEPNCTKINIDFSVNPVVRPFIPTFNSSSDLRALAFECSASMSWQYQKYIFDVIWYIDKEVVATKRYVKYESLKSDGCLHKKDWNPKRTIGFMVRCGVRARLDVKSIPTRFFSSEEFFAGAKVEKTSYSVVAGSTVTIRVTSTVPIACAFISTRLNCDFRIELFSFENQFENNKPKYCNQSITSNIKGSQCGINFKGENWNQWHSLTVTALVDKTTRPSYIASVKLRAIASPLLDSFWTIYHLPEIQIHVHANQVVSGTCSSYNDPTISTFDGMYFATHDAGEFVLFRHKTKPLQIHTIHRWDSTNSWEANCAVAIRAASDIFIVYGCTEPTRWITRRLNCDGQRQTLQVFNRNNGQQYEIVMPTGTRVEVNMRTTFLKIYIYTSSIDYGLTEGLCGNFNGKQSDDYTTRQGNIVTDTSIFVQSWSVPQRESLFISKSRNEILTTSVLYCSCIEDTFKNGELTEKADCTWQDSLPMCHGIQWNLDQCSIGRKKRSVFDITDDLEIDVSPDITSFKKAPNESYSWRNGWTLEIARQRCVSVLMTSPLYGLCNALPNVNNDILINSCVDDIKTTGSDMFLNETADVMQSKCINEVRVNASLWSINTTSGKPLAESIAEQDCPNDCSSVGTCITGACYCPPEFTGEDCSAKLEGPLEVVYIAEDSLCDLKKRNCFSISLFGKGFYRNPNITCLISEANINGSIIEQGNISKEIGGKLVSFSEVKCQLPSLHIRRRRSVGNPGITDMYLISISMNGKDYSRQVPLITYDSSCTDCRFEKGTFVCRPRTDICVEKGKCYDLSENICLEHKSTSAEGTKMGLWIIGVVLVSVCCLVIALVIIAKIWNGKRRIKQDTFTSHLEIKN